MMDPPLVRALQDPIHLVRKDILSIVEPRCAAPRDPKALSDRWPSIRRARG